MREPNIHLEVGDYVKWDPSPIYDSLLTKQAAAKFPYPLMVVSKVKGRDLVYVKPAFSRKGQIGGFFNYFFIKVPKFLVLADRAIKSQQKRRKNVKT